MEFESPLDAVASAGGTVTAREAIAAGLRRQDLYALRDAGELIQLSRGVYRLRGAEPTPYLDLIAVCRRVPHGTICLSSALHYWDLTDELPASVHLAVPRGMWPPSIDYPPTRVHAFGVETFELGRQRITLDSGERIAVYSPERTLADMMRMRDRVGPDQALRGLRGYLARPGARPGELLACARRLRAGRAMAGALEVLLA